MAGSTMSKAMCWKHPAEPAGSQLKNKVHHTAYPCVEAGGVVFTYMGARTKFRYFQPTPGSVCRRIKFTCKKSLECNYLQGLDGDCDSAHLNFLHKMFKPDARREFLRHEDQSPAFEIEEMDFGFRVAAIRKIGPTRVTFASHNLSCLLSVASRWGTRSTANSTALKPSIRFRRMTITPGGTISFKWSKPMTKEDSSKRDFVGADYRKLRNIRNNYLQDRQIQKTVNFTGIEEFLNQDACATESMGPIVDRTKKHLGVSDSYVIQVRRFLLKALNDLEAGKPLPGLVYDSSKADFSRIRCNVAYLSSNVSWRTLFEDKSGETAKA